MLNLITPWRSVAAAFAFSGALLGCWASRIPAFVDRLDLNEQTLGFLLLALGVGALVSFPLAGRLSDRWGAVRVTRWIAVIYLVAVVLLGLANSMMFLIVTLFLFGFCHGGMDVAMNSWASEVERFMGRSVMSSVHAMWSFGAGLAAAGGYFASAAGISTALHFFLAACIVAALFGPFLMGSWTSDVSDTSDAQPLFAVPRGPLILVGFIALAAGIGEGAAVDWSAVYLKEVLMTSEAKATLGYAAFSLTMVAMRLTIDRAITRFGPTPIARLSGLLAAGGYSLYATTSSFYLALVGFVFIGMGYAAIFPMAVTRAANDPNVPPGQAIASIATLGYGAILLGPPAIGFIAHETSLAAAFLLVAGVALIMTLFAGALTPATRSSQSNTAGERSTQ